ncbi:hypothetical protein EON83_00035 [bacterium]|nr:MAG: hypothetical protein EON83_00035 [bacterium]
MSHIIHNPNGVEWDVFLTTLDGDAANAEDNQLVGRSRSLAGAAVLLLDALDQQAREALEVERAHIEALEGRYVLSQVKYLSAQNKAEKLEMAARSGAAPSGFEFFGFQGGRA